MNTHLNYVINELKNLNSGKIFIVKDLFKGYEWADMSIGDRSQLGISVLNEVKSGSLQNIIKPLDKTHSNQQKYQKI